MIALPRYYLRGLTKELYRRDVFLWAQAIGFKVLITVVPIIVLATGLAGALLRQQRPFSIIEGLIRDFLPSYQSDQIVNFLSQLQSASGTLTLIGAAALALTAITLFTTLRTVIANVFAEEWHEHRSLLMGYLFDLRMALQVGLFFLASTLITVARETINEQSVARLQSLGLDYPWLQEGWQGALDSFGFILPLLLSMAMFYQLIWFTPLPRPPWRSALTGAFFTGLLWELGKVAFSAYASGYAKFEEGALAALGDTFVLVIVIVFWAYFSGLILTMGAIVTLLHERKHRRPELMKRYYPSDIPDELEDISSVSDSIQAQINEEVE
ncbi:MAG: YihY/virulence factor BrkB family protein [Proteobacteria bacterium]|nr:YihY/virulence factor BrkB family protein [Pseudomonadota bacterium]